MRPFSSSNWSTVEMATHSSILAWKTPWTEEPGGPQVYGVAESWHGWTHTHTYIADLHLIMCSYKRTNSPNCGQWERGNDTGSETLCCGLWRWRDCEPRKAGGTGKEVDTFPEPPVGIPCWHLDFSPTRALLDLEPTEMEDHKFVLLKLRCGHLSKLAIGN